MNNCKSDTLVKFNWSHQRFGSSQVLSPNTKLVSLKYKLPQHYDKSAFEWKLLEKIILYWDMNPQPSNEIL